MFSLCVSHLVSTCSPFSRVVQSGLPSALANLLLPLSSACSSTASSAAFPRFLFLADLVAFPSPAARDILLAGCTLQAQLITLNQFFGANEL